MKSYRRSALLSLFLLLLGCTAPVTEAPLVVVVTPDANELNTRVAVAVETELAQRASTPPQTSVALAANNDRVTHQFVVTVSDGLEMENPDYPSVYIAPRAVDTDTILMVQKVEQPPANPDGVPAGPAFSLRLGDGNVRAPIEIALVLAPVRDRARSEFLYAAYYDDAHGWLRLPSWFSAQDGKVHALTNHFSIFGVFDPLLDKPQIYAFDAVPSRFENVGVPACFRDALHLRVEVDDPQHKVQGVETSLRFTSSNTALLVELVQHAQAMFGAGLVMEGGAAALPTAAQSFLHLSQIQDPGVMATDWAPLFQSIEADNLYTGAVNLTPISSCDVNSVDNAATSAGIDKIIALIRLNDGTAHPAEQRLEIPVSKGSAVYPLLLRPGPDTSNVQPARPTLKWELSDYTHSDFKQRVFLVKGKNLWGRWFLQPVATLEWDASREWRPEQELEPGEYVWGVELVTQADWLGLTQKARSNEYHFTVQETWVPLEGEGALLKRGRSSVRSANELLHWVLAQDGEIVLIRPAATEFELDVRQVLTGEQLNQDVVAWLAIERDGELQRVSADVLIKLSDQVAMLTPTPTPTRAPTQTQVPEPTPTATKTLPPIPSHTPTSDARLINMPNVVGKSLDAAVELLKQNGFEQYTWSEGSNSDVGIGLVYDQKPRADTPVDPKRTIPILYRNRGTPTSQAPTATSVPKRVVPDGVYLKYYVEHNTYKDVGDGKLELRDMQTGERTIQQLRMVDDRVVALQVQDTGTKDYNNTMTYNLDTVSGAMVSDTWDTSGIDVEYKYRLTGKTQPMNILGQSVVTRLSETKYSASGGDWIWKCVDTQYLHPRMDLALYIKSICRAVNAQDEEWGSATTDMILRDTNLPLP